MNNFDFSFQMIDNAYDSKAFNNTLANIPAKRDDVVDEKYLVHAAKGAEMAVKVTDMLGEEVLSVWEG